MNGTTVSASLCVLFQSLVCVWWEEEEEEKEEEEEAVG